MNMDAYFTDDIIIITPTYDKYGDESGTTESTVRGRVTGKNNIVRDFKGKEVVSHAEILINNISLDNNARIKYNSVEHSLLSIETMKDFMSRYITLFVA